VTAGTAAQPPKEHWLEHPAAVLPVGHPAHKQKPITVNKEIKCAALCCLKSAPSTHAPGGNRVQGGEEVLQAKHPHLLHQACLDHLLPETSVKGQVVQQA